MSDTFPDPSYSSDTPIVYQAGYDEKLLEM